MSVAAEMGERVSHYEMPTAQGQAGELQTTAPVNSHARGVAFLPCLSSSHGRWVYPKKYANGPEERDIETALVMCRVQSCEFSGDTALTEGKAQREVTRTAPQRAQCCNGSRD